MAATESVAFPPATPASAAPAAAVLTDGGSQQQNQQLQQQVAELQARVAQLSGQLVAQAASSAEALSSLRAAHADDVRVLERRHATKLALAVHEARQQQQQQQTATAAGSAAGTGTSPFVSPRASLQRTSSTGALTTGGGVSNLSAVLASGATAATSRRGTAPRAMLDATVVVAAPASSEEASSLSALRAALASKDAALSSLQSRLEAAQTETRHSALQAHRLQTQVDLINRQLRHGEDYKTLVKHLAAKCFALHYRQWQASRDLQQQIEDVLKNVAQRGQERAQAAAKAAAAALMQSASQAASVVNTPHHGAIQAASSATATTQMQMPPSIDLGAAPLASGSGTVAAAAQHGLVFPRSLRPTLPSRAAAVNAAAGADGAAAVAGVVGVAPDSPSRVNFATPSPPPPQTFSTAVGQLLLGGTLQDGMSADVSAAAAAAASAAALASATTALSSGSSSDAHALVDVNEWLMSSRAIWTAEKAAFARAAQARRERLQRLTFRMQEHAAATAASASTSTASTTAGHAGGAGGATAAAAPSSSSTRLDQRLLRENEKRRRATEEGPLRRTGNLFAHWNSRRRALLHDAPGLLALALEDFGAREAVARVTLKAWQQRNTQLLLDCAALQHEKGTSAGKVARALAKAARMEKNLAHARDNVCFCAKLANSLPKGSAIGRAARCLCDCVEDCNCAARQQQQQQHNGSTEASGSHPPTASLTDLATHFSTVMAGGHNERVFAAQQQQQQRHDQQSNFEIDPLSAEGVASPPSSKGKHMSQSISMISLDGGSDTGGGGNGAHGSYHHQTPTTASSTEASVHSVPWLQRIVKLLRARLFAARDVIAHLQREVDATRNQQQPHNHSNGSSSAATSAGLAPVDSRGRAAAALAAGSSLSQHQSPKAPSSVRKSPLSGSGAASHRSPRRKLVPGTSPHQQSQQQLRFGSRSARFTSEPQPSSSLLFPPLASAHMLPSGGPSSVSLMSTQSTSATAASAALSSYPSAVPLSSSQRTDLLALVDADLEQQLRRAAEKRDQLQLDASEYVLGGGRDSSMEEEHKFDLSAACAAADVAVSNGVAPVPMMDDEDAEAQSAAAVAAALEAEVALPSNFPQQHRRSSSIGCGTAQLPLSSSAYGAAYEVRRSKKQQKTSRALQKLPSVASAPRSGGSGGGKKRTYVLHSTSDVGTSTAAVHILQTPATHPLIETKRHEPAAPAAPTALSPSQQQQQPPDDAEYAADFD